VEDIMQRQPLADYEFWFVVGSQFLYGKETLDQVAAHAQIMVQRMNASGLLPCKLVYKATVKTPEEIEQCVKEANYNDACAGLITWMHYVSPSKMWIRGSKFCRNPTVTFIPNSIAPFPTPKSIWIS
jgi:L-arabinose isomerase